MPPCGSLYGCNIWNRPYVQDTYQGQFFFIPFFHPIANNMQNDLNDMSRETLEKIRIKGNRLIDRVREVIEEGNARRILVQKDNRTVMEFPLVLGVGGAAAAIMIAPTLAAIGAFASLVSDIQVVIERRESESVEEDREEAVAETNEA